MASHVGQTAPQKQTRPLDLSITCKDAIKVRDLSTTISEVDFMLPLTISRKYRVFYSWDDETDTVGKMVQIIWLSKEKNGRYKGRPIITTLALIPEKAFKRMYGIPSNANINNYKTMHLNTKKLPPYFDVLP